jgi:hypothetical protein
VTAGQFEINQELTVKEHTTLRGYSPRTEVVSPSGGHVRWIPAALAEAMVQAGGAAIHNQNGKVRSIRLLETAASHAHRIGEASDYSALSGTKFVVREKLDCGATVWKHHPRCLW